MLGGGREVYLFTTHGECTVTEETLYLEKYLAGGRYFLLFLIIFVTIIYFKETYI